MRTMTSSTIVLLLAGMLHTCHAGGKPVPTPSPVVTVSSGKLQGLVEGPIQVFRGDRIPHFFCPLSYAVACRNSICRTSHRRSPLAPARSASELGWRPPRASLRRTLHTVQRGGDRGLPVSERVRSFGCTQQASTCNGICSWRLLQGWQR